MNSREEFLKSLRVDNTNNTKKRNRYKSDIKAEEMAKKPGLYKRAAALFLAGAIVGASGYKVIADTKTDLSSKQQHEMVVENLQNNIPPEIYFANKDKFDNLQKNIAEYNKLNEVFFKNDEQEKRFSDLEKELTSQYKFTSDFYLSLIKHKIADEQGFSKSSHLIIVPNYDEARPRHYAYNKFNPHQRINADSLDKNILDAITDVENYQSRRKHDEHSNSRMAKNVLKLNESMMNFSKTIDKDKSFKKVAMKKDDGMER